MAARQKEYTILINFARREAYLNTVLGIIGGLLLLTFLVVAHEFGPVSYTHLDVYKRQVLIHARL